MPPAARLTDPHTCPAGGGPVIGPCAPTVLIGGLPAARIGDLVEDPTSPDVIVRGSRSVMIGGSFAARMGDNTAAGGIIASGCFTVLIGDLFGPGFCLKCAAKAAAAFISGL
jgi:uncharacterized Zn-binding protein involved in type VI secretion